MDSPTLDDHRYQYPFQCRSQLMVGSGFELTGWACGVGSGDLIAVAKSPWFIWIALRLPIAIYK